MIQIIETETELINKQNALINTIDFSLPSAESLKKFSENDWFIFISAKTMLYGRNLKSSMVNAKVHLKTSVQKRIKLWGYKDTE